MTWWGRVKNFCSAAGLKARSNGEPPTPERRLYEWNARNIITLWGTKCTEGQNDDLNLYAYKEWQGMFASYFLPRWREFFARLEPIAGRRHAVRSLAVCGRNVPVGTAVVARA